jgi:hypothetical protein
MVQELGALQTHATKRLELRRLNVGVKNCGNWSLNF